MKTGKLIERAVCDDLECVAQLKGKKYKIITAKKFRSNKRVGPAKYFGIILGEEIKSMEELK